MKILHLLTRTPDETVARIIAVHEEEFEVTVVDLRETGEYEEIMARIIAADKVMSW